MARPEWRLHCLFEEEQGANMITVFLAANLGATIGLFFIAILVWRKLRPAADNGNGIGQIVIRFDEQQRSLSSIQASIREEFALNRSETGTALRGMREEIGGHITTLSKSNEQSFALLRSGLDQRIIGFQEDTGKRLEAIGTNVTLASKNLTEAVSGQLNELRQTISDMVVQTHRTQKEHTE